MKIFQIGFNRCGTMTLHNYFQDNGLACIHWDRGRLAKRIFENRASGKPLVAGYDGFEVFTDMDFVTAEEVLEAYKLYPELAAAYPDAVFILNTRDREAWIGSRLQHNEGGYLKRYKAYLGAASTDEVTDYWRRDWDEHLARVRSFFAGKPYRFVEFDIETDGVETLNAALPELDLDPALYRHRHKRKGVLARYWEKVQNRWRLMTEPAAS